MRDIIDDAIVIASIAIKKIKFGLIYLFKFEIGRFILGAGLMVIGAVLCEDGIIGDLLEYDRGEVDNWSIVMLIGVAILLIQTIRFVFYAWIINPIRFLIKKFKK
tara:strand:- start:152 stop:466 length:315 start_codon:yes stop_codon:yes gene_type:complete